MLHTHWTNRHIIHVFLLHMNDNMHSDKAMLESGDFSHSESE